MKNKTLQIWPVVKRDWLNVFLDPAGPGDYSDALGGTPGIEVRVPIAGGLEYMKGQLLFPGAGRLEAVPDPSGLSPEGIIGSPADLDAIEDLWVDGIEVRWKRGAGPFFKDPVVRVGDRIVIEGDGWIPRGLLIWAAYAVKPREGEA